MISLIAHHINKHNIVRMPFASFSDVLRKFPASFPLRDGEDTVLHVDDDERASDGAAEFVSRCCEGFGWPYQTSGLFDSTYPTECAVCLEPLFDEHAVDRENALTVYQFSCGHFFHFRCIREWINRFHTSCPLCRRALDVDSLHREHSTLCDLRDELRRRLRVSSTLASLEYYHSRRWILRVGLAYEYLSVIATHGFADFFFYQLHADDLIAHDLLKRALKCSVEQLDFGVLAYIELRRWFRTAGTADAALLALIEKGCVDAYIFMELRSDLEETSLASVALTRVIQGPDFDASAYTLLKSALRKHNLVETALNGVVRSARFDPFFLMDEIDNMSSASVKKQALTTVLPQIEFTSHAFQVFRKNLVETGLLPEVLLRIIDMQDFTVYRFLEIRDDLWNYGLAATALSILIAADRLSHDMLWRVEDDLRRSSLLKPTLLRMHRTKAVGSVGGPETSAQPFYDRSSVCRRVMRQVFSWWKFLGRRSEDWFRHICER